MNSILFITRHGAELRKSLNRLVVITKNKKLSFPIATFSSVFVVANVKFSAQVIKFLSKNNKCIFIMKTNGKLVSSILPEVFSSSTKTRERQYLFFHDNNYRVFYTKELLKRKAFSANNVITKILNFSGEEERAYLQKRRGFYADFKSWIENSSTLAQFRGIDGFIMRTLYDEFSKAISRFWYFEKRSYHPPGDEVNSVLSLVFNYGYATLIPIIISFGFDPYLGFFHEKRGQHAALASDLLELLRPALIFFTADLLNAGYLEVSDFKKTTKGVFIKSSAVRVISHLFVEKVLNNKVLFPVAEFILEVLKP